MKNSNAIGMAYYGQPLQTILPQKQIMERYGLTRSTLYIMAKKLNIKKYYIGRKVLFDINEIEEAIRNGGNYNNTLGQKKGGDKV